MAEALNSQQTAAVTVAPAASYSPSWLNRLIGWIERLPLPAWLTYLLTGATTLLLVSIIKWRDGAIPFGELSFFYAAQAFIIPYMIAVVHYLDCRAGEALDNFRPLLLDPDQYPALRYRV